MLWLPEGMEDEIWALEEDESFNDLDRFGEEDQPANKVQGALRDLYSVLPDEYRDATDFNGWVPAAFMSGMNDQRSFTVTRLRHHPDLFDSTTAQLSSQEDRRAKKPNEKYYDTTNVPILHADYQGKYDATKIFLHPLLFIVHATITHGPATAAAMKMNRPPPKVQSVANLWGLRYTTPGMIAAAAIWLRWLFSVDDQFLPTGRTSAIEWQKDFEFYLQFLSEGLLKKKASVLNIFRVWDRKFYPNYDESLADGPASDDEAEESRRAALEEMNADESEQGDGGDEDGSDVNGGQDGDGE
ncbi:hypothetical protein C8R45DRAFT_940636 [Mycena sanguinolenta]|nr:hypothetical protein C8R45DRAFT_940636 [Mycena sanguinolenta]